MKRSVLITLSIIFSIGTIVFVAVLITSDIKPKEKIVQDYNPEAIADWPVYDFKQLMNDEVDLIVFATVEDVWDKKTTEDEPAAKLSTLNITDLVYSKSPITEKDIVLDQAIDFVEPNKSYLLILQKVGEYYYEADGNSVILEDNNMYEIRIPGIGGKYNKSQITQAIEKEVE